MTNTVERTEGFFAIWTKLPLTWLTGVLGFVYGIGFAFGWWDAESPIMWAGAVVVGVCFVASLIQGGMRTRSL